MKPSVGLCLAAYAPHLVEEHVTRMHDDPLIVFALRPLSHLGAREATYSMFQAMLLLALATTYLFSLGGRARELVLFTLGVALVGEAHHVVRALATLEYNSGLFTSAPMPLVGGFVLASLAARWRAGARARPMLPREV